MREEICAWKGVSGGGKKVEIIPLCLVGGLEREE